MIVAPPVVPQAVVMVVRDVARGCMSSATCSRSSVKPGADAARHEARDRRAELRAPRPGRMLPRHQLRIDAAAGDDVGRRR